MSFFHNSRGKFSFKFSLFHVKIDVKVSVKPKNNFWKEISVSFCVPKKALLSENVIRLQSQMKRCLQTFEH